RVPGEPLGHAIEGFGAGSSFARRLQLLVNLPAILSGIIEQWVDVQTSLHQLPVERLLQAVTAAGIDARVVTFEGQLARLRTNVERHALTGLEPGLDWLDQHRPPQAQ